MFIKKDRRRIDEILADNDDTKESLQLSKRAPEFNGNLRVLCRESNIPFLGNLRVLNLYDNALNTLTGIGHLSQTPLEELNLGCNNLSDIPLEVNLTPNTDQIVCIHSSCFSSSLLSSLDQFTLFNHCGLTITILKSFLWQFAD